MKCSILDTNIYSIYSFLLTVGDKQKGKETEVVYSSYYTYILGTGTLAKAYIYIYSRFSSALSSVPWHD
jgi:hypothetical protein